MVSEVASGHFCLSSPGKMPGIGFCSISLFSPNPAINKQTNKKTSLLQSLINSRFVDLFKLMQTFVFTYILLSQESEVFTFPQVACKSLTEPFGVGIHVFCSWSVSQGAKSFRTIHSWHPHRSGDLNMQTFLRIAVSGHSVELFPT